MDPRSLAASLAASVLLALLPVFPDGTPPTVSHAPATAVTSAADVFDRPLATWSPQCLGFGSQWRICNGTVLRACADGAVWLHTGADVVAGAGDPVASAGDGVIIGYMIDPQFRGGALVRHVTTTGVVITQYWHVWLRPGFIVGTAVKRGQVFANVADMGGLTHLHFAVFNGDYEPHAWNGALPPAPCSGFPAFPYRFIDPNAFLDSHAPVLRLPAETRY